MPAAVEMVGVEKRFPRVLANTGVNLAVEEGEIHALVGENGAGKSTLMKILCGLHAPDGGVVRVHGQEMTAFSPARSIAEGIGMVHQHFMLVPTLTVSENVALGQEPRRGPLFDRAAAEESVAELGRRYGLPVEPRALVGDLPVGLQQRVEILKVLARGARILILDEPTAVLSPQEADALYATLRSLKEAGRTIIFISHKLREVRQAADRLTVLRRGTTVATLPVSEVDEARIAELMVGRAVAFEAARGVSSPGGAVVEARALSGGRLREASFDVCAGEVVGIAGVEGNGQSELVEILSGLRRAGGSVRLGGVELGAAGPARWFDAGLAVIPEDRNLRGLIGEFSVADNLMLGRHRGPQFSRAGVVRGAARDAAAADLVMRYDIRPADHASPAGTLSGGNQQKVIVARELSRVPRFLLAAHPTRGVDVGAIEFIHRAILAERARGAAVLLVSSELSEIMALSDRILVLCGGRFAGELRSSEATEVSLGVLMTGGRVA